MAGKGENQFGGRGKKAKKGVTSQDNSQNRRTTGTGQGRGRGGKKRSK